MILSAALVTGAGRGYELELCRGLAARGAHVFGVVRGAEGAAAFADVCGGSGTPICADVADEKAGETIAATLAACDRPLDLLVNNAGVMTSGARIEEVRLADLDHLLRVHVHGPIRCTQAALPWLRRSPQGTIVNVTSRLGSIARVASGAYDHLRISYAMRISKAAQNMLTACLHRELAAEGIAVYAIHPGWLRAHRQRGCRRRGGRGRRPPAGPQSGRKAGGLHRARAR